MNENIKELLLVREAIVKRTYGQRGVAGEIDCPVCQAGKLRFVVEKYNGHIRAFCATDGCVRWM